MALYRISLIPRDEPTATRPKIALVVAEGKGIARQIARARYRDYIVDEIVRMQSHSVPGRKEIE